MIATQQHVLLEGGQAAFDRILERVGSARRNIAIRCFSWRDDQTGELLARALLAAADRGVQITIFKDLVAASYEYFEATRQSFFHKDIDLRTRLALFFLAASYIQPGIFFSLRAKPNPLAARLLAHPNITVHGDRRRFDHSKVYVVDDEVLFVGGIGIGDDARLSNLDFMVEIVGEDHIARYYDRWSGRAAFDRSRTFDFLLHTVAVDGHAHCPLLSERLHLMRNASTRLTIEMAYLSDPRITDALVAAVDRGVALTLVTGERASVIGDLNLATCDELLRRTGSPDHLRVVLHPRPVHSKAVVVDGCIVDIGSANFTRLSHGVYDEVDVCVRDAAFAHEMERAVERHASEGRRVAPRVPFNRLYAFLERSFVGYRARWG